MKNELREEEKRTKIIFSISLRISQPASFSVSLTYQDMGGQSNILTGELSVTEFIA